MPRYDAPVSIRSRSTFAGIGQFNPVGGQPVWTLSSPLVMNEGASVDFRTMCSSPFIMLFSVDPTGASLTGTGLTLTPSGPFSAALAGPPGITSGIRIIADDQHGGITFSPTFSVNVLAPVGAPLVINIAPFSVRFEPGVAGQSVNLAQYVSTTGGPIPTPTLIYSLLDALPGVSLQGSIAVYDQAVLSGNADLRLSVNDQAFAVPVASLFAINDSQVDGASAAYSHPFAKMPWRSTAITYPQSLYQYGYQAVGTGYGDCVGTDGIAYPTSQNYFARVPQLVLPQDQALSIPAASLVNYWIAGNTNWGMTLIGSAGAISNFADRTNATVANRPTLQLVLSDGTHVAVPCAANRSLIAPSTGTTACAIDGTAGVGSLLLYFNLTQVAGLNLPVQSATSLTLFGKTRGVANTISMYATDMSDVLRAQAPILGLAQNGVKDAGLVAQYNSDLALAAGASPPARPAGGVLYAETWPNVTGMAARNYYARSSGADPGAAANLSLIGATDPENPGYAPPAPGINALKIKMLGKPNPPPPQGASVAMNVIWPFNGVWGYAPTHVWLRFYMMFANDWPFYDQKPGSGSISRGKFPVAPSCHVPPGKPASPIGKRLRAGPLVSWSPTGYIPDGGNGGTPATGACMWSMRNYWYAMGNNGVTPLGVVDPAVYGPLAANDYWPINSEDMYSADQWNAFGDDNFWMSERTIAALMKKNTPHCIELHVKMNSLWTAAGPGPDPVYLGSVRHMPYRTANATKINDQLGNDNLGIIETFTDHILVGNVTGQRYCTGQLAVAPDTAIINSATQYGTPSMIGVKDGIYEAYVDGVLAHRRTDLRWRHIPDAGIDCLWFDYGQTQLDAGSVGSVYFSQIIAVDGDIVTGPIGPMRLS